MTLRIPNRNLIGDLAPFSPAQLEDSKVDFGHSTSRKLVVEDVVNSDQKMAEAALYPVK